MTSNHSIVPHLIVNDAAAAAAYYIRVFGAREELRLAQPDGRIHAELSLEGARFMLADEYPELGFLGPDNRGGTSATMTLYVGDVDAFAARAQAAGATLERPISDEFYGDRVARFADPFGHVWSFHTRIEELSPQVMQERLTQLCASGPSGAGERAALLLGFDHVGVTARDVAATAAFYEQILGMRPVAGSAGRVTLLANGGVRIAISPCQPDVPLPQRFPRGDHVALRCHPRDGERLLRRLGESEVEHRREGNRVYFEDPDGRTVEVEL